MADGTEPKQQAVSSHEKSNPTISVIVAIIGVAGTVIGALITGIFLLLNTQIQIDRPAMLTLTAQSLESTSPTLTATMAPDFVATIPATNLPNLKVSFIVPDMDELRTLELLYKNYIDSTTPTTQTYKKTVSSNESFLWEYFWCTENENILQENFEIVNIKFLVDGVVIPEDYFLKYRTSGDLGGADADWVCQAWATILTKWVYSASSIKLSIFYTIARPLSDGKNTYQPGDYRHDINVWVK